MWIFIFDQLTRHTHPLNYYRHAHKSQITWKRVRQRHVCGVCVPFVGEKLHGSELMTDCECRNFVEFYETASNESRSNAWNAKAITQVYCRVMWCLVANLCVTTHAAPYLFHPASPHAAYSKRHLHTLSRNGRFHISAKTIKNETKPIAPRPRQLAKGSLKKVSSSKLVWI